MAQVFVNQKYHKSNNDTWINNVHVKTGDNFDAALMAGMHQYHAFMSTYAYAQDGTVDYASCSVETLDGAIYKQEVDNRLPVSVQGGE